MNDRLTRVGQFLSSLKDGLLTSGQNSVILSSNERFLDGGDNTGECFNTKASCNGYNAVCTNKSATCDDGENAIKCENTGMDSVTTCCNPDPNQSIWCAPADARCVVVNSCE